MGQRESARSIRRFVELLELFDERRVPLTSADIAAALQSPRSSTAALLRSLVDLGVLIMDRRSATFMPSMHVAELTEWVVQAWIPGEEFVERLQTLRRATQETISVWTVSDLEMEVLHVLEGASPLTLRLRAGQRFPLFLSGVGTAFMMSLTPTARAAVLRRFERHTNDPGIGSKIRRFREQISAGLRKGYALVDGAVIPDVASIAIPVKGAPGRRPLVVSVGGLARRIHAQEGRVATALKRISFE